jgi:hypothetical protein
LASPTTFSVGPAVRKIRAAQWYYAKSANTNYAATKVTRYNAPNLYSKHKILGPNHADAPLAKINRGGLFRLQSNGPAIAVRSLPPDL